jgi:GNAT superfamily N-acetyltransferase
MIKFELATTEDAKILAKISKRAFDNDVNYGSPGKGGPPGYDSPEFQVKMISTDNVFYYKILSDDNIIGGFWIRSNRSGIYSLDRIYIEPAFQNQGIGTQAFQFIFEEFPEARSWILGTPAWNSRTRHFYEKLGFEITKIVGDGIHYKKKGES